MVSTSQKKGLHALLATNLSKLSIPPSSSSSSSSSSTSNHDLDFSHVFGPLTPQDPNPSPLSAAITSSPRVIQSRSHSFVGPSPRFAQSSNSLFSVNELDSQSEDENETDDKYRSGIDEKHVGVINCNQKVVVKIGPGDFEILRMVGQGAFGKVFQVRKKRVLLEGSVDGDGDGIFAMKVMRKETIIKKNHVDYMKAERDILTKVVHPFIVQLRYSFQVPFYASVKFML